MGVVGGAFAAIAAFRSVGIANKALESSEHASRIRNILAVTNIVRFWLRSERLTLMIIDRLVYTTRLRLFKSLA